jgi:hypothetical protein
MMWAPGSSLNVQAGRRLQRFARHLVPRRRHGGGVLDVLPVGLPVRREDAHQRRAAVVDAAAPGPRFPLLHHLRGDDVRDGPAHVELPGRDAGADRRAHGVRHGDRHRPAGQDLHPSVLPPLRGVDAVPRHLAAVVHHHPRGPVDAARVRRDGDGQGRVRRRRLRAGEPRPPGQAAAGRRPAGGGPARRARDRRGAAGRPARPADEVRRLPRPQDRAAPPALPVRLGEHRRAHGHQARLLGADLRARAVAGLRLL